MISPKDWRFEPLARRPMRECICAGADAAIADRQEDAGRIGAANHLQWADIGAWAQCHPPGGDKLSRWHRAGKLDLIISCRSRFICLPPYSISHTGLTRYEMTTTHLCPRCIRKFALTLLPIVTRLLKP